jgi:hypothetical protein
MLVAAAAECHRLFKAHLPLSIPVVSQSEYNTRNHALHKQIIYGKFWSQFPQYQVQFNKGLDKGILTLVCPGEWGVKLPPDHSF